MIAQFFDRRCIIKKLNKSGYKKRWSSTATVDMSIQDQSTGDGSINQQVGADYQAKYTGFAGIEDLHLFQVGRLITDQLSGIEYSVDKVDAESHPITGTEYVEIILVKTRSKSDGGKNWAA